MNLYQKGLIEKKLLVKKAANVQGAVCIHFPNPKVKDLILSDSATVDLFSRINISKDDIEASNLRQLMSRGDVILL